MKQLYWKATLWLSLIKQNIDGTALALNTYFFSLRRSYPRVVKICLLNLIGHMKKKIGERENLDSPLCVFSCKARCMCMVLVRHNFMKLNYLILLSDILGLHCFKSSTSPVWLVITCYGWIPQGPASSGTHHGGYWGVTFANGGPRSDLAALPFTGNAYKLGWALLHELAIAPWECRRITAKIILCIWPLVCIVLKIGKCFFLIKEKHLLVEFIYPVRYYSPTVRVN